MSTPIDNTNDAAAGCAAGKLFAHKRASITDRLTLSEVQKAGPGSGTLLECLFAAYAEDDELSPDEVADLLFGDAAVRPSDAYVAAFLEGAIAALEAFAGSGEDDEDDGPITEVDSDPLAEATAAVLDWCLESGMSFPMTMVLVSRMGGVMAVRYAEPGDAGELIADRAEEPGMTFPVNGLVTDEAGGAAHVRIAQDGTSAQLLVASESPPLQS
jgi:hypothetical protein